MRLKQVKLAGFKSFVEPTIFQLPSQLVGIVGPNGCGKSNIIDAVRWVLGESKASELRGESMQDVIFNGTSTRKPASRASVELVFSNELGRVGGQWGQFTELAIKRIVTREGASNYYVNNQVVRRRDVQDIFMGTGLGPRAYAIIGQGMIARIIEAKPEELRVFLEEAAGVSKYKERRRETENRLYDTRDNLSRVDDILRELNTQVTKLNTQAQVAREYTTLKANVHQEQGLLAFVRQQEAKAEQQDFALQTEAAQIQVAAAIASVRTQETVLEHTRQQHGAATDALQQAQAAVFTVSSQVAQLEADLRLYTERKTRLTHDLARHTADYDVWQSRYTSAQTRQAEHISHLDVLDSQRTIQQAQLEEWVAQGEAFTKAQDDAQTALDACRLNLEKADQTRRTLAAQHGVVTQHHETIQVNLKKANQAVAALITPDVQQLAYAKTALLDAQCQQVQVHSQLVAATQAYSTGNHMVEAARSLANTHKDALQRLEARHLALAKLQQSMQAASKSGQWLKQQGFKEDVPRFWQQLQVTPGWETAVQAVLQHRAQALYLPPFADVASDVFASLIALTTGAAPSPPAAVSFFTQPLATTATALPMPASQLLGLGLGLGLKFAPTLLSQLNNPDASVDGAAKAWLGLVYCADNLQQALAQRQQLPAGAMWVTPEGHRVDAVSVHLFAAETLEDHALVRQHEIEQLLLQIKAKQLQVNEAQAQFQSSQHAQQQASADKDRYTHALQHISDTTHRHELEVLQLQQAIQQFEAHQSQLQAHALDLYTQAAALKERLAGLELSLESADEALDSAQEQFEFAREAFQTAHYASQQHQQKTSRASVALQETHYQWRSGQERLQETQRALALAHSAMSQAQKLMQGLVLEQQDLGESTAPIALHAALLERLAAENNLSEQRTQLEQLQQALRQQEETRLKIERTLDPLRASVNTLQLKEQAARLAVEQFTEQLAVLNPQSDPMPLVQQALQATNLPKPASVLARITALQQQVAALGAVNLAALQELTDAQTRHGFLSSQALDLSQAMATLEDAIRTIDRETRAMLKNTFEQVNHHFGRLFPQLFGGGEARLVITGDEILDAGLQVLAQPPGKRNTSIHLLSGGEKALTATALVFAIFQLNPAPFCLLDEVDAPLDDSNTERFANMVASLAQQTQFIFISHNKIAMEMAQQLIGVTMQEQGVSRIVAVDMTDAVSLLP